MRRAPGRLSVSLDSVAKRRRDYLERRKQAIGAEGDEPERAEPAAKKPAGAKEAKKEASSGKRGLTWAEQRELEGLLDRVDQAEREVAALEAELGDASFYARSDGERRAFFERLAAAKAAAEAVTARWAELEERREG